MMRRLLLFAAWLVVVACATTGVGQEARFHVLAFYSTKTEPDHVQFSDGALEFFRGIAAKDQFSFEATTNWDDLNSAKLSKYQVVMWLNDFPKNEEQRRAFQSYMEGGGAWLGFHVSAYNDSDTHWPWLLEFLGGGVFDMNSWPPLPAKLVVEDRGHAVTAHMPESYLSPANEWYIWKPSPRANRDVRVLVSLDASNYPLGLKDVLMSGDLPVVWTNTKYKMVYMNMGHGDKVLTSATQNRMFEDAVVWLGAGGHAEVAAGSGMRVSPRGVVVNSKTGKAYGVNTGSGTVTVVDGARRFTVKVGEEPISIAVNVARNKIYVGNSGSGTVSVIDGATDAVVATVKVGELPTVVAVNPATDKVYVSRTFGDTMSVIDGATNVASVLKAGVQADAMAVNPVTNKIYLVGYEGNDVTVIDGATDGISKVAVGKHLWGVAVNPATNKIYFTNVGTASLAVMDGATNSVKAVGVGEIPCAVAVDAGAGKIYVANYGGDSVTVIDAATDAVVATVKVGAGPQAIAVDAGSHRVFVADTHGDSVTVIEGSAVVRTVKVGKGPYAVEAGGGKAYVNGIGGELRVADGR